MSNRKIIFKVTAIYMLKNRKRTIISFVGILVMVLLMTAVFVGKDTIMEYMRRVAEADQGKWHLQVYDVDAHTAERIGALESVETMGYSKPLGYTFFPGSGNPEETPFLEVKAYTEELFDWMNISIVEGRAPEAGDEIVISERAIKEGSDIGIGDTLEIELFERYIHAYYKGDEEEKAANGVPVGAVSFLSGFRVPHGQTVKLPDHFGYVSGNADFEVIHEYTGLKKSVKVVGIMESPFYEAKGQGGYMALMKTDKEALSDGTFNIALITDLASGQSCYEGVVKILYDDLSQEEKDSLYENGRSYVSRDGTRYPLEEGRVKENSMLLIFAAKGGDANLNMLMTFFQAFFIILITAAALILIGNVFSISFRERSRYLGMLSSVGATRSQKKWSVYFESFVLLAAALPLGILLGILTVGGAMKLLYPHFSHIIEMIASNVITGKSGNIGYRLVVSPLNILFIILFSSLAVWVSAWLPALKISKTGPLESIRGNKELTAGKSGVKSRIRLMKKGRAEELLAVASVGRNRYSTRGIVRSITAFIALTLISAFAARSFMDILQTKASQQAIELCEKYRGFDYLFTVEDGQQYAAAVKDITGSEETVAYRELNYQLFSYNLAPSAFNAEYREALEAVIGKYYPDGIPAHVADAYLDPGHFLDYPAVNMMVLTDEDYRAVAAAAGIDTDAYGREQVLVYDSLRLTTDDHAFSGDGAIRPAYTVYKLKKPLSAKPGDTLDLLAGDLTAETEAEMKVSIPVTFAGYVSEKDISEYFVLGGSDLWMIISEETYDHLESILPFDCRRGVGERMMLFKVWDGDTDLVRALSQVRTEFGDSALVSAALISYSDFKNAIVSIVNIVAVCFTLLISVICLLNLYNSVMGRRLARHRELAVLDSLGITGAQRLRMLMFENLILLVRSFVCSGIITAVFVIGLRTLLNRRFGRMLFTLPVWLIVLTAVVSIGGLALFTAVCYNGRHKTELIDEIRTEMV